MSACAATPSSAVTSGRRPSAIAVAKRPRNTARRSGRGSFPNVCQRPLRRSPMARKVKKRGSGSTAMCPSGPQNRNSVVPVARTSDEPISDPTAPFARPMLNAAVSSTSDPASAAPVRPDTDSISIPLRYRRRSR
jgi:hypothetical protein